MSYTLIERKELTSPALSIDLTNIPQYFTDIIVVSSLRATWTGVYQNISLTFNGSTADYSWRLLAGDGSSTFSASGTRIDAVATSAGSTANTFSNSSFYIPNYSSNLTKSVSIDTVSENNASSNPTWIAAGLWANTAPITSLTVSSIDQNFLAGSSISLYGINRQQAIGAPKAIGGAISWVDGYWIHTFTGSGTFYTQQSLDCEYLVVAGGGAGGFSVGGGGGAGGFRTGFARGISGSYPVTVGSGGAGLQFSNGGNGGNSSFAGISSTGGGGGGNNTAVLANNGGSGGGSGEGARQGSGNLGGYTPVEGYAGGAANDSSPAFGAGGGGGASDAGRNGTSSGGGNGGSGIISTITGPSITYAGGGGGSGYNAQNGGIGGSNIGGNGSYFAALIPATNGMTNRGGGGGGGTFDGGGTAGSGGSGIVIVRYKA